MLLGLQRKGVHVDARAGGASVVLPRLHAVEVASLALGEAVLTVELDLGDLHGVLALALAARLQQALGEQVVSSALEVLLIGAVISRRDSAEVTASGQTRTRRLTHTRHVGEGVRSGRTRVASQRHTTRTGGTASRQTTTTQDVQHHTLRGPVIRVVEGLLSRRLSHPGSRGIGAVHEGIALHHPDEFLHGVVKVHLDLVAGRSQSLIASELQLVDQVLVGLLGKATALLSVQVHVVHVQRGSSQLQLVHGGHTVAQSVHGTGSLTRTHVGVSVAAVVVLLEVHVDAHLVVLQSDQGDSQTRIAAEPELQGDVQSLHGSTSTRHAGVGQLGRSASGIQSHTLTVLQQNQVRSVADHVIERLLSAHGLGQLSPDLHPVTVLAVDAGATDLDLHLLDQTVTHVVEPAEAVLGVRQSDLGQHHLDVRAVHQIRVTGDYGSHTTTEVSLTVEGHLDSLHSKIGVALVHHLPESNLGVAGDVDVLSTVRYELH